MYPLKKNCEELSQRSKRTISHTQSGLEVEILNPSWSPTHEDARESDPLVI